MQRQLEAVARVDHGEVVQLPHVRDGHRRRADTLAELGLTAGGLDVHDDVAFRKRTLHGRLDPISGRVPLPHGRAGRDTDHDVRERAPAGLAQPEPPEDDGRVEPVDRLPRGVDRTRGGAVHQDIDIAPDEPGRGGDDEDGHEQRGDRVTLGEAGPRRGEPRDDRQRPEQVGAEVDRVGEDRRARVPSCRPVGDDRPRDVDRDHESGCCERPPGGVDVERDPSGESGDGERADDDGDEHEEGGLGERGEVLRLPVAVEVRLVRGLGRPSDREEREQGRDEVGPRVGGLCDEPEAAGRQPGRELDRDQEDGGDDRRERGAAERRHGRERYSPDRAETARR